MPQLPEPQPIPGFYDIEGRKACRYTADQMQAYAAAAVAADRLARAGGGSAHTGPAAQVGGGSGGSGGLRPFEITEGGTGGINGAPRLCPTCGIVFFAGEGRVHCGDKPMVKVSDIGGATGGGAGLGHTPRIIG